MPAGIEICGLQDMYGNEEGKNSGIGLQNWQILWWHIQVKG